MKKKFLFLTAVIALLLLILPACDARNIGSLKSITRPYIAQYECTSATFGEDNLLEKYDYIEIVLVNKNDMEILYKPKNSKQRVIETTYSFNTETSELTASIGILGYRFKDTVKIENGKFTVKQTIARKQLIMNFQMK